MFLVTAKKPPSVGRDGGGGGESLSAITFMLVRCIKMLEKHDLVIL